MKRNEPPPLVVDAGVRSGAGTRQPVILMYHGVIAHEEDRPDRPEAGACLYDVCLADFEEQMAFLAQGGCVVSTDVEETTMPVESDVPYVVLTFDDGERNNLTRVVPVLQRHGFRAFFFVTASRIGEAGYLDEDDLHVLFKAGMVIGGHGYDHDLLVGKDAGVLRQELVMCRQRLSRILGCGVECFSVPRGFYDDAVLDAIAEAGFRTVFVSFPCPLRRPHPELKIHPRVAVKRGWTMKRFVQAVEGRRPAGERLFEAGRRLCLGVLGPRRYNAVRQWVLR